MDYFCLVRGADVVFPAKEKKKKERNRGGFLVLTFELQNWTC